MTNHWQDIQNADVVLIMGGNAAEAHPCGFKWVIEAKKKNKARLVVVDPRFTRSAAVADYYAPVRAGSDIAFLAGVLNYLLSNDKIQTEYVRNYTNAPFIVGPDYKFEDGIFSGYNAEKRNYDPKSWNYALDEAGMAKVDMTMQDPQCVLQVMKRHYARYTPELVSRITGTPQDKFLKVCEYIASTSVPGRTMTVMYALGWTQHSQGSQMIRTGAIMQLLLGNIGVPGGGMNALRGHSNIQGLTDLGLLSNSLPGYMSLARDSEQNLPDYYKTRALKALRPNQMSYWQNYPKFFVSMQKSWWGDAATADNEWAFHYLPKIDKLYDILQAFELMNQGKLNGYICQGFNPVGSFPDKKKIIDGLSKLKFLVTIDPLITETSEFWRNFGEFNDVKTTDIQTTVFRLPSTCFAEEDGSLTNSSRWLQWHWKGAEPPGEAKGDIEIVAGIFNRIRQAYVKDGGAFPDPIVKLTWPYKIPHSPSAQELAMEYNGRAITDLLDPKDPTKPPLAKAGEQLSGFGLLRDDGSTASGCWIYAGAWTQAGNQMGRRDNADPYGIGMVQNWAWAWPANRRILYNGASTDPTTGKAWIARRNLIAWNGKQWAGADVPDIRPDANPMEADAVRPVHHDGRRRGAALRAHRHGRRSAARALRALRVAAGQQPDAPEQREGARQPRGAHLQRRPRAPGRAEGLSIRGHQLPAHGALPLLDQERAHLGHHPAAAVRRDRRRAGQGERHCQRRHGEGLEQARLHQGRGAGDQAHRRAAGRRAHGAHRGAAEPLGLRRHREAGVPGEHVDAVRGRCEHADAGVQVVHGEHREGMR
jgi:formate dehydrogenase major subunit